MRRKKNYPAKKQKPDAFYFGDEIQELSDYWDKVEEGELIPPPFIIKDHLLTLKTKTGNRAEKLKKRIEEYCKL